MSSNGFIDRIKHKENRLSAIIADLLSPSGSHGQQRIFLDAFLRQIIKRNDLFNQPCKVDPESKFPSSSGKIDILIDFGDFGIGIENKPWANDGDEQLHKYSDSLDDDYRGQYCLIYLTPYGNQPSENSIEAGLRDELHQLLLVSYCHDMLNWLRECVQLCESDRFRWFLRDFMDYFIDKVLITTNYGDTKMPSEDDITLQHALESKKNLEMALDIAAKRDELHK